MLILFLFFDDDGDDWVTVVVATSVGTAVIPVDVISFVGAAFATFSQSRLQSNVISSLEESIVYLE